MEAYLDANDFWETIEDDYMIPPLLTKIKCKVVFIFYCIPSYLCMDHEGNEKFKGMQLLNLIRGFEMQRMKELQLGVLWQTSKHP